MRGKSFSEKTKALPPEAAIQDSSENIQQLLVARQLLDSMALPRLIRRPREAADQQRRRLLRDPSPARSETSPRPSKTAVDPIVRACHRSSDLCEKFPDQILRLAISHVKVAQT